MAVQSLNTLKAWFKTGKKPTQQQFYDLLESCINGAVAIGDIPGLSDLLAQKLDKVTFNAYEQGQSIDYDTHDYYTIPAGYLLEKFIPYYSADSYLKASLVAIGNNEIADIELISAGWNRPVTVDIVATADTNFYIDGIPAGSKIVFFKRKIKMD